MQSQRLVHSRLRGRQQRLWRFAPFTARQRVCWPWRRAGSSGIHRGLERRHSSLLHAGKRLQRRRKRRILQPHLSSASRIRVSFRLFKRPYALPRGIRCESARIRNRSATARIQDMQSDMQYAVNALVAPGTATTDRLFLFERTKSLSEEQARLNRKSIASMPTLPSNAAGSNRCARPSLTAPEPARYKRKRRRRPFRAPARVAISSAGTVSGLRSSTMRSANLPTSIDPVISSWCSSYAALIVAARNTASGDRPGSSPSRPRYSAAHRGHSCA